MPSDLKNFEEESDRRTREREREKAREKSENQVLVVVFPLRFRKTRKIDIVKGRGGGEREFGLGKISATILTL